MEIVYGDNKIRNDYSVVSDIAKKCNITMQTAGLLYCRGFDTPQKVDRYLNPGKHGFHDPLLLCGMREAIDVLFKAKNEKRNVFIFGDYDADGICAVAVLKSCLQDFGINADFTVPERDDGYGLNLETVKTFHQKKRIDVLITVDCGISDFETIEEIKKLGINVIVTDHHEPPSLLPDTIVIDPKIEGQDYPFSKLSGAGVAYKLGTALIGEAANKYLDVVSLATVADSMELVGENRDIVYEGLKTFNSGSFYPPLKRLLGETGKNVTASTLAFVLSPRINAGGRMGDAESALKLMTATDEKQISELSAKLNQYNVERQVGCDEVYNEAKQKILQNGLTDNSVIMVSDDGWQAGFIGIVASRLVEEYMRPVIVFAKHGDLLKGSARSVDSINVYDAISSVSNLLVTFGGHSQAAGVTVSKENFAALQDGLNEYVRKRVPEFKPVKTFYADMRVDGKFSLDFAREIERMEPFGTANRRPIFSTEIKCVNSKPLKTGSCHYSFDSDALEILDFNGGGHVDLLSLPIRKTILFDTNLSMFKGREYLKGYLRQIVLGDDDLEDCGLYVFAHQLKSVLNETLPEAKVSDISVLNKIDGCGTLYAVSNVQTLNVYPALKGLPVSFFVSQDKSVVDKIIISPTEIPFGTSCVVWLDEPISFVKTELPTYCNFDICGYEALEYVDTDRSVFAEVYKKLCSYDGCEFNSSAEFFEKHTPIENGYQFVFSTEVFLELGLIKIETGKLKVITGIKNPLTNSKIYNKVYEIRG